MRGSARSRLRGGVAALLFSCAAATATAQPAPPADFPSPAPARRLALVTAVGAYSTIPLPGAAADAQLVADALKTLGFEVDMAVDKSRDALTREALKPFLAKLKEGDIVVFYFSGHGFSYAGEQYLVPRDAPIGVDDVNGLPRAFLSVSALHAALSAAQPAWILMALDACRTPANLVSVGDARQAAQIHAEFSAPSQSAVNTVIAYAASPGHTAEGSSDHRPSVYTRALAEKIATLDEEMDDVLKRVRSKVIVDTLSGPKAQEPWTTNSSSADVYLRPPPGVEDRQRSRLITAVKDGVRSSVIAFLLQFGAGPYGAAARWWLANNPDAPMDAAPGVDAAKVEAGWRAGGPVVLRRVIKGLAPAATDVSAWLPNGLDAERMVRFDHVARPTTPDGATPDLARRSPGDVAIAKGRISGRVVPGVESAEVVLRDRERIVVEGVVRDAGGGEWVRGRAAGDRTVFLPRAAERAESVSIGSPLAEALLFADGHGDLDLRPLAAALERARAEGRKPLWASLAAPKAKSAKEAAAATLRVAAARVALAEAQIPRDNMSVDEDQTLDAAMRVRLFGR